MDSQEHIVYDKADIPFLKGLASDLNLNLHVTQDMRIAQEQYEKGAKIPGTEDGHEPLEMFYMHQILEVIEDGTELPKGFVPRLVVYLNDRGFAHLEEDVPTLIHRDAQFARRQLFEGVQKLTEEVAREKAMR